jgi:hypothetical protein
MKFLELKHNISGKELFTMQARYRSDIDIKLSTRTMALDTELTARAKTISVFAAGHRFFFLTTQDTDVGRW